MLAPPGVGAKIDTWLSTFCLQVRVRGDAAAAAKRELEAGRAALARGRDELLHSQRALAQAQVSLSQITRRCSTPFGQSGWHEEMR